MLKDIKQGLRLTFVVVGTLVGAGFASGKEIYSFFFVYGVYGIIGMLFSSVLIGIIIYKVLKICKLNDISTYHDFCTYVGKGKTSGFLNSIVNIFLLISYFVMIAGFSSFVKQEFNINGIVASLMIVIACYFIFLKNVSGLIKISNYLIPILIFFIVLISIKNVDIFNIKLINAKLINIGLINNTLLPNTDKSKFIEIAFVIKTAIKSILYASYNCIILIPVLVTLSNQIRKDENVKFNSKVNSTKLIAVIGSVFIMILSLSVFNILLQGNIDQFKLEMPIIGIVKQYGNMYQKIYLIIIGISIFTTAISSGCGFLNNCSKSQNEYRRNLVIISILAIFLSQIPFSVLVNLLYPILGIVGIFEIIVIFV